MKKQDEDLRRWLMTRQSRRDARSRRLAGLRRGLKNYEGRVTTSIVAIPVLHAEREESRRKIEVVLNSILGILMRPRTRVRLDFSRTHKIYPGGMLILLSHIALFLELFPGRVSARCMPNSMPAQLLNHFGYSRKLGLSDELSRPNHESVVKWRYLTGTDTDGPAITDLLGKIKADSGIALPDALFDVLTEALANVCHHAYPASSDVPNVLKKWWIFSRLDIPTAQEEGRLYIGVYDIGVGIMKTMREQLRKREAILDKADHWFGWLKWPKKVLEQRLLLAAIEHQRSRTGFSFRGNGLPEMREFVLQTDSGSFSVISGKAQYTCKAATKTSTCNTCDVRTPGTLVLWSIPLRFKEHETCPSPT